MPTETAATRERLLTEVKRGCIVLTVGAAIAAIAVMGRPYASSAAKNAERPIAPWDHVEHVQLGGFNRHFIVHVPPTFESQQKLAAVIMLHGAGGTAQQAMEQTGWDRKADQENFVAVFPDAVPEHPKQPPAFLFNPQTWNDGSGRHASGKRKDDDVGFVSYIIETLESRYRADPNRIYVTGFSNGASMTFRVGVELSDKLAAIAPVAGHLFVHDHQMQRALPALYIIGRNDPLELPAGGVIKILGEQVQQPVLATNLAQWRQLEGCPPAPSADARTAGVERITFGDCRDGVEVVEYFIDEMGHVWPGGVNRLPERLVGKPSDRINATDLIWSFFKAHPKQP